MGLHGLSCDTFFLWKTIGVSALLFVILLIPSRERHRITWRWGFDFSCLILKEEKIVVVSKLVSGCREKAMSLIYV